MATFFELYDKLSDDSQIRGRQFEHICKWYLQNNPKYRLQLRRVWLWSEWPDRWGPDAGIDLIAQTYDERLWAIQAKAYAKAHHVTKADVDTFLSESSREVFSYRLLIATTNFIGRTAERTLDAQEQPVGKVLLSDLQKSEVVWPESPERLEAKQHELKKSRPHQEKAISKVCEGFSRNDRGQLIMASGTGKTLVSLWIAERLQSQRTLVILPSLSLLGQTLREWTSNASCSFHYLPVCSDDTVRGADRLISKTSGLGLPATTVPDEIAEFLKKEGCLIVFATYQSSPVIAEAFKQGNVPPFNLAVADEAHRCAGFVSSPFATILDEERIKTQRRLFMTATPRYFTDRVLNEAKEVEYEIASMDEERKFGPIFHKLSYSEAIQKDLLSDYRVVIIGVDNPTYLEYAEQGTFVTTDGERITDARILASQITIAKAMRKYDLRRIISFHSRIKRAKEFSERLPGVINWIPQEARPGGQIWSKHVSGLMHAGQRDVLLDHFKNLFEDERGLLANAQCLGEGVDVPSLDGIAFVDPRSSQLDIIQAVGRAIRKAPDKTIGTIVLPVFIDSEQDPEIALNTSSFEPVWNVLKALRAHDEVLGEVLDKLRRQIGRDGSANIDVPEKLSIDLPITVDESFVHTLRLKSIERSTASWEFWYGLLERYVELNHHANIDYKYVTESGFPLGKWIGKQHKWYIDGKMSDEHVQVLESMPEWRWDRSGLSWKRGIELLREYAGREKHTNVPKVYLPRAKSRLGVWVSTQRSDFRNNRMSIEKQQEIEKVPYWIWDPDWDKGIQGLRVYVIATGHTKIPDRYLTKHGFELGRWVRFQREFWIKGTLLALERKQLEQFPGWIETCLKFAGRQPNWFKGYPETWAVGFRLLRRYADHEGHTFVPKDHLTDDGYLLGKWVSTQRDPLSESRLSLKQRRLLAKLPGWVWDILQTEWAVGEATLDQGFSHLRNYIKQTTNASIPNRFGRWANRCRLRYREGNLPAKAIWLLENISNWTWELQDEDLYNQTLYLQELDLNKDDNECYWKKGFKHFFQYVYQNSCMYVPEDYITQDGFQLGAWFEKQSKAYARGRLS